VLCYATDKLLRDEAESMVPNGDPEQVRKIAGGGLTQNDRASFVGWSQSLISRGSSKPLARRVDPVSRIVFEGSLPLP